MENESCIKDILTSSLNQVRTIIDADTIVGQQIVTPSGVVIVPISKVSMGFVSGGLDLPGKTEESTAKNFGGGGGTGVTVSPVGFLVISPEGEVEMLPMVPDKSTPIEQIADIINNAPDVIARIKNVFVKGASAEDDSEEDLISEQEELAELEEAYRQKMAQIEADEAELAIDETEKLLEAEAELTKADKKRMKKEAKELKKLEKLAKKAEKEEQKRREKEPELAAIEAELEAEVEAELEAEAEAEAHAEAIDDAITEQTLETGEVTSTVAETAPAAPATNAKRGKISQKTLESGRI